MSAQVEPDEIDGCFVVEVGERQAWPFVTFCDNRGASSREVRLYLDSSWALDTQDHASGSSYDAQTIVALLDLNNLTVERARVNDRGDLEISFAGGSRLIASGTATAETVGEPWRFSPWTS
jgi:hypothetical protein